MNVPDNYDAFVIHESRQEAQLKRLPLCSYCDEHIQSDEFYLINDEFVCPDCLDWNFKQRTEDYIE